MLYQGEDITLKITGDELVDFDSSNFVVLLIPKNKKQATIEITKNKFQKSGTNTYTYVIPHFKDGSDLSLAECTDSMQGSYDIEILLEDATSSRRSIFVQENAIYVEFSNLKNYEFKQDE